MGIYAALIDRSEIVQKMLSHCLYYFAVEVLRFDSFEESRPNLSDKKPDIIFVDWSLKKGNKAVVYSVIEEMKQTPVVLLYRSAEVDQVNAIPDDEIPRKIKKPLNPKTVRDILMELVPKAKESRIHPFLKFPKTEKKVEDVPESHTNQNIEGRIAVPKSSSVEQDKLQVETTHGPLDNRNKEQIQTPAGQQTLKETRTAQEPPKSISVPKSDFVEQDKLQIETLHGPLNNENKEKTQTLLEQPSLKETRIAEELSKSIAIPKSGSADQGKLQVETLHSPLSGKEQAQSFSKQTSLKETRTAEELPKSIVVPKSSSVDQNKLQVETLQSPLSGKEQPQALSKHQSPEKMRPQTLRDIDVLKQDKVEKSSQKDFPQKFKSDEDKKINQALIESEKTVSKILSEKYAKRKINKEDINIDENTQNDLAPLAIKPPTSSTQGELSENQSFELSEKDILRVLNKYKDTLEFQELIEKVLSEYAKKTVTHILQNGKVTDLLQQPLNDFKESKKFRELVEQQIIKYVDRQLPLLIKDIVEQEIKKILGD